MHYDGCLTEAWHMCEHLQVRQALLCSEIERDGPVTVERFLLQVFFFLNI